MNLSGTKMKAMVAVSSAAYSFDKPYSYLIPGEMLETAKPGSRAIVPFGRANRKRIGIILEVEPVFQSDKGLKPLFSIPDDSPVLSSEMLELMYWLRDNTFCTYFDAVKTLLPSGMNINIGEEYALAEPLPDMPLSCEESNFLRFLENCRSRDEFRRFISCASGTEEKAIVRSLIEKKYIILKVSQKRKAKESYIKMLRLSEEYINAPESFKLTPKQKALAEIISERGSVSTKEACYLAGVTSLVADNLVKSGAAEGFESDNFRMVSIGKPGSRSIEDVKLTDYQQPVYDTVAKQIDEGRPECFLLHGITGSGKTAVFEKLIGHCVNTGKQAMLLIPEISLTPQIVRRFQEIFGETVAVLHSGLTDGQRLDQYRRIKLGLASIAIGTRSAVFAPFDNIGLIIVDEEGERSYKSDSSPRYNAIEVAKKRCRTHSSVLLLASATPSVESYYNAMKGRYKLLEMNKRYSGAVLPEVTIVDMNDERMEGNTTEFSRRLTGEIRENLLKGEQTILLLNRRGYHTIISCCDCNKPLYCPNCSVPMTYHKANDSLMCHYCGHVQSMAEACPVCGGQRLIQMGFGTQKMEEQLSMLFPEARILRMDADTTFSRDSYEKRFKAFADGEYDIMVGTQMIGKGLDFPNVTLVGVLSVDKALYAGDFRSYERTFSLVAQVVGRCGRGSKKGRAFLQTFMPEHYVLSLAAAQDYKKFYNEEIAVRRALIFPPVCDICALGTSGENEDMTMSAAEALVDIIRQRIKKDNISFPLRVLGPVKCSYGKLNGKYRYRIIIKCKNTAGFRAFVGRILEDFGKLRKFSRVSVYADINGDIGI